MDNNRVFALDIGTRSVVGLIAEKNEDDSLEIIDVEVNEHPERSMIGGQIHDIPRVAKIIADIKHKLETRMGIPLKDVAVAAAGRSLLTTNGHSTITFPFPQEVTMELFYALQLEAVQQAQHQIQAGHQLADYHCVGFSIAHQFLDEIAIGNLVGQIGTKVAVEIIATFLPRIVIDSLHSAILKAGLEMGYITLEPIAAMNLAVPANMRQLNIVLVDIGAGTSDIAISDKGTVKGYAMIPKAGDQVTEALCQAYLLDFPTGENVKKQLHNTSGEVSFKDIMGISHSYPSEQILFTINDAVTELARQIARKVMEINGRSPQAVLCIGGGSLTPTLPQMIAQSLDLPENRVALIGQEVTAPLTKITDRLPPPQAVTPLAIIADTLYHHILEIMSVTVNGKPVRLFATKGVSAGDALVAAGISPGQYLGRIGSAISLEVNGEVIFIKGQPGQQGKIGINDQEGELTALIQDGDRITFTPGTTGMSGKAAISDVLPKNSMGKSILLNGQAIPLLSDIRCNGKPVKDAEVPINDGCKISYAALRSVRDLLEFMGYDYKVPPKIIINGMRCNYLEQPLVPDDEIKIDEESDYLQQIEVNGQAISLLKPGENVTAILTDIFNFIDFDPKSGIDKKLIMEINGEPANFVSPIKTGDKVIIKWINKDSGY